MNNLIVQERNSTRIVKKCSILYLLADQRYTTIFIENKKNWDDPLKVSVCKNLGHFEETLDVALFQRINRSTIVSIDHVVEIKAGAVVLDCPCGGNLVLDQQYRQPLLSKLGMGPATA